MNVIFHLVSLGVLLALLAQVAKQRLQFAFARKFIAASAQPQSPVWHVDWFHRLLNSLSYALSVVAPSKDALGPHANAPVKTDLRLWSALHAHCQIMELRSTIVSGHLSLNVFVLHSETKAQEICEQIKLNMPKDLSILITQASPAAAR